MVSRFLLANLIACLALPEALAAELTGQIRGSVLDPDGLAVPSVLITVTSPDMLGVRQVETNAAGDFLLTQLPVGDYRLEAAKAGFNTYATEGLRVNIGGTTLVEVMMEPAVAGATVVIVDRAPTVDTEKVRTGVNLSTEQLRDLPTAGRDYQSIIAVAPGVVGSGNANIHGGMDNANQYYLDGVNITDPVTNTFSLNMNYDAIQEVQVITGGMDAEYGRSLGGAVNIITKSGGNEVEVLGSMFYSDENFAVYKPDTSRGDDPDEVQDYTSQQYALNVGGPILKDQLWYFVSLQMDVSRDRIFFDNAVVGRPTGPDPLTGDEMSEVAPRDWKSYYYLAKLTWQPNSTHRLWVHAQGDPTVIKNTEQDPYTLPSAERAQRQGGWVASVGHVWMPSQEINLETQVYFQRSYINVTPMLWEDCKDFDERGVCTTDFGRGWSSYDADGFSYGSPPYAYFSNRQRASVNSALSWFPEFMGTHRVKIGVQAEVMTSEDSFPGIEATDGIDYWSHNGDPTDLDGYTPVITYRYDNDQQARLTGSIVSFYAQDVWQPIDRLTLRPGLRFDKPTMRNDVGDVIFDQGTVSPRFGAAYDLFGDATTSLHAYYGHFSDPSFLEVTGLALNKSTGYGVYSWDDETGDWGTEPSQTSSSTFLVHDELRSPSSDEINVGVTRALNENVSVDATYVWEKARNFWEDDEVNLIWNADGTDVIGFRNGSNESIYRLRTPDELYTRYHSVELTATANLDLWWFLASYTWGQATGTSDNQVATAGWDIPEQRQYESGYLSYDRTHAVKVSGTKRDTSAWSVGSVKVGYLYGANFRIYSGLPYRKVYWNDYYQDWNNYTEPNTGVYRTPALSQTDLRAGLTFGIGPTTWALTADCINALNDRSVTSVNTTWGDNDGEGVYLDSNGEPLFGAPVSFNTPRRFQVGLRGEF